MPLGMTNDALLKALGKFTPDEVAEIIRQAKGDTKKAPPYMERIQNLRKQNFAHIMNVLRVMGCPEADWWDCWWYDWCDPEVVETRTSETTLIAHYCQVKLRLQNYSGEQKEVIFELS